MSAKKRIQSTCAGADIKPTAIPQMIRPARIIMCDSASAIDDQPRMSGATDMRSVDLRPYASMMGTEARDPIGVAAE
jgi:hypothetical protein